MKRRQIKFGGLILFSLALYYPVLCYADSLDSFLRTDEQDYQQKIVMVDTPYNIADKQESSSRQGVSDKLFDVVIERSPALRRARLLQGRLLIESNKPEQAIAVLSPLLFADDADWQPWFWMGTANLLRGNLKKAASYLDTALSYNNQITEIWVQRAIVAQELGNFEGSLQLLRIAIDISPDDPQIWLNYAYVNDHMNNRKKAITAYRKFLRLSSHREGFSEQRKAVVSILLSMN